MATGWTSNAQGNVKDQRRDGENREWTFREEDKDQVRSALLQAKDYKMQTAERSVVA